MQYTISELYDKASCALFAISNVLYKYKQLPISRAFQLFGSLIRPIALFSCEFCLPFILCRNNFVSKEALIKAQSCKKAVSWYLGYQTILEENPDIFKKLLLIIAYLA